MKLTDDLGRPTPLARLILHALALAIVGGCMIALVIAKVLF